MDFLRSAAIEEQADGTLVIQGFYDGFDEPRELLRSKRAKGQRKKNFHAVIANMALGLVDNLQFLWKSQNGISEEGTFSIEYDDTDENPATSYKAVVVLVGAEGKPVTFSTGNPIADWKAAGDWTDRYTTQTYLSSSVDQFVSDVAGFVVDEYGDLIANPEDTVESRRTKRFAEQGESPHP